MANRVITFLIQGSENVSAAARAAAQALQGLSGLNKRIAATQKSLDNSKGMLKQIERYKKLNEAIDKNVRQQAQLRQDGIKALQQQAAAQRNLAGMREAFARLQASYKENRRAMAAADALAMKEQIKAARAELRAAEKNVGDLGRTWTQTSQRAMKLQDDLNRQRAELARLRTQIPTSNIAAAESALRHQIQQTTNALNQQLAALERRNQFAQAKTNLSNAYSEFQNALQTGSTLVSPFVEATKNAITFEREMSKVKALTQMRNIRAGNLEAVNAEMRELTELAEKLGATTEFTATEVAQAMGKYGMSGWSTDKITAIMRSTVDLASIAGDHNIMRSADVLSDDLAAFGLQAGKAYKVASGKVVEASQYFTDAFAYAITQANLDRESLHEAWKYNAPAAHASGLSLGETMAMNMVAANAGIKGSMAGTAFRAGWTRFLAPPKTAVKAFEEMGYAASDATKAIMESQAALGEAGIAANDSLFDKITKAYEYYQTLGTDARSGWLKNVVGQNALSAWQTVFDTGKIEEIKRIAQEIDSGWVEGWSAQTAGVMRENTATELEYLSSAWDALSKSVGDAFLPAVTSAAPALADIVSHVTTWIQKNQTLVQWLGLVAAAISAIIIAAAGLSLVGAVVTFLSTGFAMLGTIAAGVAAAVGAISLPFLVTVAAVWALLGVLYLVGTHAEQISQALTNAWNHPQGAVVGFCELLKSAISSAVDYVLACWETLKSALSHPLEAAVNFMTNGTVVGGNVVNGYDVPNQPSTPAPVQAAAPVLPTYQPFDYLSNLQAQNVQVQAAQVDMPEIDTTPITDAVSTVQTLTPEVQAIVDNIVNTTPHIEAVNEAAQTTSTEVANVGTAAQTAAPQVDSVGQAAQTATPLVDFMGQAAQTAAPLVDFMGQAAGSSVGNLSALSSAASSAANSLGGLAGAVSSAISNISAAGSQAVAAVRNSAPTANSHNARGGIYNQGAFTTWFAEDSPEAAIPIDSSARAKNLWFETGSLLGMFDNKKTDYSPVNVVVNLTVNGRDDAQDWVTQVRDVFEDLSEEYFGEQRRRSFA